MKRKKLILIILAAFLLAGGTFTAARVFAAPSTNESEAAEEAERDEDANLVGMTVALTPEQASQYALARFANGTVLSIQLEDENGAIVYAVGIQDASSVYDVKVDANTGVVLTTEDDSDSLESEIGDAADQDDVQSEQEGEFED